MNIKQIIEENITYNKEIQVFVNNTRLLFDKKELNDEKEILKAIFAKINQSKGNPILLELLCDFLEFIDDEKLLETYSLINIEQLRLHNMECQNLNLPFLEDVIYFYWNIMDDADNGKKYLNDSILILENKLNEFKILLNEIENDIV